MEEREYRRKCSRQQQPGVPHDQHTSRKYFLRFSGVFDGAEDCAAPDNK
jgi:hypothetical protein